MNRVLVLGGTTEGRELAARLAELPGVDVVSSLAGRVNAPRLPAGGVRIGGFGGPDGLAAWLRENDVDAVIDATHPFAATMTRNAAAACGAASVPLVALQRPPWVGVPGDHWTHVPSFAAAADAVETLGAARVFLTIGRQNVSAFVTLSEPWFLIRSIDQVDGELPARRRVLLARGPFGLDEELATLREHRIDLLVSKNSGGSATAAKLEAARELGLPVLMIDRPALPDQVPVVHTVDEVVRRVLGSGPY